MFFMFGAGVWLVPYVCFCFFCVRGMGGVVCVISCVVFLVWIVLDK